MNSLKDLRTFSDTLAEQETKCPLLFVGHGSPMNGIEDNEFSQRWKLMASEIPTPKAVLCISAHWFTQGTHITAMEKPETIHDFYGFPKPLFDVQYPAPGNPALAKETASIIHKTTVGLDHEWGTPRMRKLQRSNVAGLPSTETFQPGSNLSFNNSTDGAAALAFSSMCLDA